MSLDPSATPTSSQNQEIRVVVTDVDISFGQAVSLLLKFTLAAIPAALILMIVGALITAFVGGIGNALLRP